MHDSYLDAMHQIASEAANVILGYYEGALTIERKQDNSPVTQADLAANALIIERFHALTPDIPIISEEQEEHVLPSGADTFWLVDPLDGTKSFIRGEGEFTVNIALIEQGVPTQGVIVIPAQLTSYAGDAAGAWRQAHDVAREPISTRAVPDEGMVAVASLSHLDSQTQSFLDQLPVASRRQASSSLKFCRVAEGEADIYPRFAPTMQWDIAAGHAILRAAGGDVVTPEGAAMPYGGADFTNGSFIAYGRKEALLKTA